MPLLSVYIIIYVAWCLILGFSTKKVIENKGYYENWFWWGFFFGIIALIVALTKPDANSSSYHSTSHADNGALDRLSSAAAQYQSDGKTDKISNGWRCEFCHKSNPDYVGTCSCGKTKMDSENYYKELLKKRQQEKENNAAIKESSSESLAEPVSVTNSLDEIKKLKELLDMEAITREEFEIKKKQLLNV